MNEDPEAPGSGHGAPEGGSDVVPPRPARSAAAARSPDSSALVPVACLAVFTIVWLCLAIAPRYREDWLLENMVTFAAVPFAVWTYRRAPLSPVAYVQFTAFMILHTLGSHYTYSQVPLGDWLRDALGLARNHYDRLVHFSFGLLMLRPLREIVLPRPERLGRVSLAWMSVAQILACSAVYELVEWLVATIVDPAAGTAYLGTQGDEWDAQKDMACAAAGALVAVTLSSLAPRRPSPLDADRGRRVVTAATRPSP